MAMSGTIYAVYGDVHLKCTAVGVSERAKGKHADWRKCLPNRHSGCVVSVCARAYLDLCARE